MVGFSGDLWARFSSRFYQTATLNHDSETRDHITWFISADRMHVRWECRLSDNAEFESEVRDALARNVRRIAVDWPKLSRTGS